jgi:hypothetical protein
MEQPVDRPLSWPRCFQDAGSMEFLAPSTANFKKSISNPSDAENDGALPLACVSAARAKSANHSAKRPRLRASDEPTAEYPFPEHGKCIPPRRCPLVKLVVDNSGTIATFASSVCVAINPDGGVKMSIGQLGERRISRI